MVHSWCFSLLTPIPVLPLVCFLPSSSLGPDISCLCVPGHFLPPSLSPQLSPHKCFSLLPLNLNLGLEFLKLLCVNIHRNFSMDWIFNARETCFLWVVFCTTQYCKADAKYSSYQKQVLWWGMQHICMQEACRVRLIPPDLPSERPTDRQTKSLQVCARCFGTGFVRI